MYELNNKSAAIRQLQHMMNLNENGIYDDKTRKAVEIYQETNSLNISGKVDYQTFTYIVRDYRNARLKKQIANIIPFKNKLPYSRGDSGEGANILNTMLRDAINKLGLDLQKPRGPYFSDTSAIAVRELRRIFMLPDADYIDEIFYDKLLKL